MRLNDAELHMCTYIQSVSHGGGLSGGAAAKIGLPTHGEGVVSLLSELCPIISLLGTIEFTMGLFC